MRVIILSALILLPLAALADYDNNGFISEGSQAAVTSETGTDAITITVLNTFSCSYAQQILGLDYSSDSEVLVFVSNDDDIMYSCDPDNGDKISELALAYTAAPSQFGVCVDADAYCYFNDYEQNHMYWWDTSSWHLMTNPVGDDGRGMDFGGDKIWETFNWTTKQIVSFNTDGSGVQYYNILELGSAQPSGLATFPCGSDLGIVVTSYNTYNFYFYSFDGSTLTSLGFVACPLTCTSSQGLTYSPGRDTFFWSYSNSSGDHSISELEIDITGFALAPATWGSVKAIDFN